MNPGCAVCTINVVHFIILLFLLSALQLKEQAILYENRSLRTAKLTKAITSRDSVFFNPLSHVLFMLPGVHFLLGLTIKFLLFFIPSLEL